MRTRIGLTSPTRMFHQCKPLASHALTQWGYKKVQRNSVDILLRGTRYCTVECVIIMTSLWHGGDRQLELRTTAQAAPQHRPYMDNSRVTRYQTDWQRGRMLEADPCIDFNLKWSHDAACAHYHNSTLVLLMPADLLWVPPSRYFLRSFPFASSFLRSSFTLTPFMWPCLRLLFSQEVTVARPTHAHTVTSGCGWISPLCRECKMEGV